MGMRLSPIDMEPWIASIEAKVRVDFKLALLASRKLELDDLFDVCGERPAYSLEDAKRLHKQQWTAAEYSAALDATVNGKPRISQGKMLEILRLRSKYIAERGATLNNPHVTKAHLATFAGTSRDMSGPNWAADIRKVATDFLSAHPGHAAALESPVAPRAAASTRRLSRPYRSRARLDR